MSYSRKFNPKIISIALLMLLMGFSTSGPTLARDMRQENVELARQKKEATDLSRDSL